ncbi:MAG: DUF4386 domain-containing protein [Flavobacteriaceae bacterium]
MMNEINQKTIVRNLRILYPIWVLVGIFSIMYVPSTLIELDNPLKTAQNITENSFLFRLGIAGRLITQLLFIIIPFLLYELFRNLDRAIATLMLILALISVPITMLNETIHLEILSHLDKPDSVIEMLELYYQRMDISVIFWGLWLLPLGWLAYKFKLFPKVIGVVLLIAGFGYFIDSFIKIVFPDFTQLNSILEIMTIGELIFIIWLVIVGVKREANVQERL